MLIGWAPFLRCNTLRRGGFLRPPWCRFFLLFSSADVPQYHQQVIDLCAEWGFFLASKHSSLPWSNWVIFYMGSLLGIKIEKIRRCPCSIRCFGRQVRSQRKKNTQILAAIGLLSFVCFWSRRDGCNALYKLRDCLLYFWRKKVRHKIFIMLLWIWWKMNLTWKIGCHIL